MAEGSTTIENKSTLSNLSNLGITDILPFLTWIGELKQSWKKDLFAGLTGAVIVLPQGVAFAMIAGLPPQYGIFTAIVPAIIAALFGSSRHLISGPTTAISLVIFGAVGAMTTPGSPDYISLVFVLTFMVGVLQFGLGAARLGKLINFVSHSVVIGFTTGAAVLIIVSQLKHVFGLSFKNANEFVENIKLFVEHLPEMNYHALIIAAITFFFIIIMNKVNRTLPNMLLGMLTGGLVTYFTGWSKLGVKVVGALPSPVPPFAIPDFSFETIKLLAPAALAVAMMGLMEAVSIARSIALHSGQRIDGNREFMGQGLSNMVGSFFSSYASSGSFTRTGVNYRAGAVTGAAGIFASAWLFLIILFIAPLAAFLPIPSMAGVILIVAYNLVDFHHIYVTFRTSRSESMILLVTFLSTLFLELEFAIYVGALLSIGLYLNNTMTPKVTQSVPQPGSRQLMTVNTLDEQCSQVSIVTIDGDLYFAATTFVEEQLNQIQIANPSQKYLLLVLSSINHIDVSGIDSLKHVISKWRHSGGEIFFYGVKDHLIDHFHKHGLVDIVGKENIFADKESAIGSICSMIDHSVCKRCQKRIFWECDQNKTSSPVPNAA